MQALLMRKSPEKIRISDNATAIPDDKIILNLLKKHQRIESNIPPNHNIFNGLSGGGCMHKLS
jgi:hypothetical protein